MNLFSNLTNIWSARSLLAIFVLLLILGSTDGFKVAEAAVPPAISNGSEPANGNIIIELEEIWRIGGEDDEDNLLGVVDEVLVDDQGNFYLLDIQLTEVLVYDADGQYLQSLGRQGDGPGEIRQASDVLLLSDGTLGLVQSFPGKVVKVNLDGTPAGEYRPGGENPANGGFFALRNSTSSNGNLVLSGDRFTRNEEKRTIRSFIAAFAADGSEKIIYAERTNERMRGNREYLELGDYFPHDGGWALAPDGRVIIAPKRNEYYIEIYSSDGQPESAFTRQYQSWKRSSQDLDKAKALVMPWRRRNRNRINFVMEPTEKDILSIRAKTDGQIWVLPSRGIRNQPDGIHSTWDVFDRSGSFVQTVSIACEGDGQRDALFFASDDLVVMVREHADALMAFQGQSTDDSQNEGDDDDIRPLEIVCYRIKK